MRESLFATKTIHTESGEAYNLNYSILINNINMDDDIIVESFGIKINMTDPTGINVNSVEIPNISFKLLEIHDLIVLLSSYTVTPVSAYEVIDDYLA